MPTVKTRGDRPIELYYERSGPPGVDPVLLVDFEVQGRDELDVVEILQDGHVVHRAYASDRSSLQDAFAKPFQVRLEWGWGPWGALALDRICDWAMQVELHGGRITRYFPCLQSMPFDEQRRHRFERTGPGALAIRS